MPLGLLNTQGYHSIILDISLIFRIVKYLYFSIIRINIFFSFINQILWSSTMLTDMVTETYSHRVP